MTRFIFAALALATVAAAAAPSYAVTPGDLMHTQWIGR